MRRALPLAVVLAAACAALRPKSLYPSAGTIGWDLLEAPAPRSLAAVEAMRRSLTRGDSLPKGGAMIEATLVTPAYQRALAVAKALKADAPEEELRKRAAAAEERLNRDRICFLTRLEYEELIDGAFFRNWRLRASLDGGPYSDLILIGQSRTPRRRVLGAGPTGRARIQEAETPKTAWVSEGTVCVGAVGWPRSKTVRLRAYPPHAVQPKSMVLKWKVADAPDEWQP